MRVSTMRKVRLAPRILYLHLDTVGVMMLTDTDEKIPLRVVSIESQNDFRAFYKDFQLKIDKNWEWKLLGGGEIPDMEEIGLSD